MTPEARITVRNAGWLLLQRGLLILSGLLFAVVVPRLMGPENYGRFALLSALAFGFMFLSLPGTTQIIGRFVPELLLEGDSAGIRKLFGNLLTLCLASGTLAACLYFAVTTLWLRDLDRAIPAAMSVAVLLITTNQLIFGLFLGLNQAARWGFGDMLRRWISVLILVPGFYLAGLPGACLGVALAELLLAAVGLWLARDYLCRPRLDIGYLIPYLRFGLIFYAGSLLYGASERSSEALVRLASGSYIEVGYFSLAYAIYQMAVLTISQLTLAFAPLLAMLRTQGHEEALRDWTERLLKWFAIAAVLLIYGTLFLAEALVPPVFGAAYLAVAGNLIPLTVALLFLGLSQVANLLALVYELPRNTLSASALRLVALWMLGLPLAAWRGSFGACLAVVAASAVHSAYITRRMQRVNGYSLRQWSQVVGLSLLFLPLLWLRSSSGADGLLYGLFIVGYLALLWLLRLVAPEDLATLRSLTRKN